MKSSINKVAVCIIAVAGSLAAVPAGGAETKLAVVDFQKLVQESPQGKEMLESLRSEFSPRERTLQAQGQALKAKDEKLQKDGATMTEDQRVRAEKELRDGAREFERARGELQDDETAKRNERYSRLQRTLIDQVRTYAKAQAFDVVVSGEVVVYANPALDITPQILSALQAQAGGARPAASTPAPKPQSH